MPLKIVELILVPFFLASLVAFFSKNIVSQRPITTSEAWIAFDTMASSSETSSCCIIGKTSKLVFAPTPLPASKHNSATLKSVHVSASISKFSFFFTQAISLTTALAKSNHLCSIILPLNYLCEKLKII